MHGRTRRPQCSAVKTRKKAEQPGPKGGWLQGLTTIELREAQLADDSIPLVIQWKESTEGRPEWQSVASESPTVKYFWAQWDRLCLREGVLYRRWESVSGDKEHWQLVVPNSLKEDILRQVHDGPTAGHLGTKKTLARVREQFFWGGYGRDVQRWCRECDLCSLRKGPSKRPRAPMKTYNVGAPLERMAIAFTGPLPTTNSGNKYVLLVSDYFKKWREA